MYTTWVRFLNKFISTTLARRFLPLIDYPLVPESFQRTVRLIQLYTRLLFTPVGAEVPTLELVTRFRCRIFTAAFHPALHTVSEAGLRWVQKSTPGRHPVFSRYVEQAVIQTDLGRPARARATGNGSHL